MKGYYGRRISVCCSRFVDEGTEQLRWREIVCMCVCGDGDTTGQEKVCHTQRVSFQAVCYTIVAIVRRLLDLVDGLLWSVGSCVTVEIQREVV